MNEDVLRDYKVDGQITLEEYLWSIEHYMALPVEEESGECKGERSEMDKDHD